MAVSSGDADLAYEYLIGHAWWFSQPAGAALLGFLAGPGSGWIGGQNLAADGGLLP